MTRKILIVEDNPDIAKLVSLHLKDLDYEVTLAADGLRGLHEARARRYDLIILDIMLPGLDGLELCRRLRAEIDYTPILMLTAKSSEVDRVVGLEIGADDYLTKPFSISELLARVKAIFRRVDALVAGRSETPKCLKLGALAIDAEQRTVAVTGRRVDLTAKEFDLLLQFAEHPGRVYSRQQLLDLVWGSGHIGYEHTVNSHINRLRGKIEANPTEPEYVLTVWGVGYKFNDQLAAG
jgi:DNA-binding response OmpR family regulator